MTMISSSRGAEKHSRDVDGRGIQEESAGTSRIEGGAVRQFLADFHHLVAILGFFGIVSASVLGYQLQQGLDALGPVRPTIPTQQTVVPMPAATPARTGNRTELGSTFTSTVTGRAQTVIPAQAFFPRQLSEVSDWRRVVLESDGRIWQDKIGAVEPTAGYEVTFTAPIAGSMYREFKGVSAELWIDGAANSGRSTLVAAGANCVAISLVPGAQYKVIGKPGNSGFSLEVPPCNPR